MTKKNAGAEPLAVSATKGGEMLNVSPNTLLKAGKAGLVPMLKLGPKTFRFPYAYLKRVAAGEVALPKMASDEAA